MFDVHPFRLGRDRTIWRANNKLAPADTQAYAIKLDKVNDVEYYFTFSYLSRSQAEKIAKKLWADGHNFNQSANRVDNPQWTLVSERDDV